jgi:predicted transcriptional regulator
VRQFGALEAAIMEVLWSRPPEQATMSVRDVLEVLQRNRELAYTTVMTVLDNLHRKGLVARERDGKAWRYTPVTSRDAYTAEVMSEMLSDSPDPQSVFLHLVEQLSPEEADQLRAALHHAPDASS